MKSATELSIKTEIIKPALKPEVFPMSPKPETYII